MPRELTALSVSLMLASTALSGCGNRETEQRPLTEVVVATPSRAGAVDSTTQNSDEFMWRLFTQFAAPVPGATDGRVIFETWASDTETYTASPKWPDSTTPRTFRRSRLAMLAGRTTDTITAPCGPPLGAAVGNFPTSGTPVPCIAEEVKRNRPQFDYIVNNNLYTKRGLAAAYAKSFQVVMPLSAIAVKGDWVPLSALLQWLPPIQDIANLKKFYHTATSGGVEYALVSLHVSSRQNLNWVWTTFEHSMTPGRCDAIGCFDSFGATVPAVMPNRTAPNTQYGTCQKTPALLAAMQQANLSPVWQNYCMKSSQVQFSAPNGTPYVLGNSVTEGIVGNGTIAASSCISCHSYASFGANGGLTPAVGAILPFNPTGPTMPAVLANAIKYDFMWGVVNAK